MKKCPVCKAEIPDDARFCIHCMTSFQEKESIQPPREKHRWWLLVLLALLLIGIVISTILLLGRQAPSDSTRLPNLQQASPAPSEERGAEQAAGDQTGQTVPTDTVAVPDTGDVQNTTAPTQQTQNTVTGETTPSWTPTTSPSTTPGTTVGTEPDIPAVPETTESSAIPPETTEPPAVPESTEPVKPQDQPVYTYRTARASDDFSANYTNSGNDIVITGVQTPSSNGVYSIPSHIDDKRVIAITANAFYGSGAQRVYLPTTIKTVWNYAFNGCPLADIYFTHNVYIENTAFHGNTASLTIHCPSNCHDRNLRTYRSSAAYYDAVWKEWNG